jgi:hypothetical protein
MPEVRIDSNLRGTAKRTKVHLGITDLADSVMITLIFAGLVAFVADVALELLLHFFQPPFGSFCIPFECGDNAGDIIFLYKKGNTHYIMVYNEYPFKWFRLKVFYIIEGGEGAMGSSSFYLPDIATRATGHYII